MYATASSSACMRSISLLRSSVYPLRLLHSTPGRLTTVSIEAIRDLRKRTGAPIGVVKKALQEHSGDLEAAIHYLRKHGASIAAKKAHREASEGLIGIAISPDKSQAAIIEVNSETDFVARTPQFGKLVRAISESALKEARSANTGTMSTLDIEEILCLSDNKSLLLNAISSLGENIVLKRVSHMSIEKGAGSIFGYTHSAVGPGTGRIGVLVALKGSELNEVGQRLAMHIAATAPSYIDIDSIPSKEIEKERSILLEVAQGEQKPGPSPMPPSILQKIVDGRLKKWYSEVVLEEQEMLVESPSFDGKPRSVKEHIKRESKISDILQMCRMVVGEK